jgi:hypothetical protein
MRCVSPAILSPVWPALEGAALASRASHPELRCAVRRGEPAIRISVMFPLCIYMNCIGLIMILAGAGSLLRLHPKRRKSSILRHSALASSPASSDEPP